MDQGVGKLRSVVNTVIRPGLTLPEHSDQFLLMDQVAHLTPMLSLGLGRQGHRVGVGAPPDAWTAPGSISRQSPSPPPEVNASLTFTVPS